MIIKKNFNPIKVLGYVRYEMLFTLLVSSIALWMQVNGIATIHLPFSVAAILGSALAIFIAFRNNNAYARWWEARTLWGNIINASRVLSRLIITFTDSHSNQANYDKERSEKFKRDTNHLLIAWAHALRLTLRNQDQWSDLKDYLNSEDYEAMFTVQHKPNFLQLCLGRKIYEAMANGTLGGFDSFQMEGQLLALANYQGGCERIKNTPLLRQYHYFTQLFLYTFMLILPFSLVGDFYKLDMLFWLMPITFMIAFVFAIIGKVGEVNEDPFENRITDVPLSALCESIERDIKEMLGEPFQLVPNTPNNDYLY